VINKKYKIVYLIIIITILFVAACYIYSKANKKYNEFNNVEWVNYSNQSYSVEVPYLLEKKKEIKEMNFVLFETRDFDINMVNGDIKSGFALKIFTNNHFSSLDKIFDCNKKNSDDNFDCLLSYSDTFIGDYHQGAVKNNPIIANGYNGIKYEFISNIVDRGNNNTGLVIKKDDSKQYVALIAYRNYKNIELFNKILDSFKLK